MSHRSGPAELSDQGRHMSTRFQETLGEAIVNAIAHRDYHSHASVEVRLFADRLEVWNPGALPAR